MSSISVTAQVLGSLAIELAGSDGQISVDIIGTAPAIVSLALGTPGPQGIPGQDGPQGPAGVMYADAPLALDTETQTLSIDLTDYALQSWVTTQLAGKVSKTGDTMSGQLSVDFGSTLGITDVFGGNIALNGSGDYFGYGINLSGLDGIITVTTPSDGYMTINPATGVRFSDGSVQSTAGISSASAATTYAPIAAAVPTGGTTGQVLTKSNSSNYALTWSTPSSGSATWGSITGTLSSQTDLNTALGLKAPLASPALTGVPTAPTATSGTSTTQIATTAFVTAVDVLKAPIASPTFTGTVTIPAGASISGFAPLASPALTGTPTAPTATAGTSTTQIATTAFVTAVDVLKAPLASPAFTGVPTAPTATSGTSTTQIATTAFVTAVDVLKAPLASPTFTGTVTIPAGASISGYLTTATAASTYAPLASPTFTGDPKAPTPATADNDTSIATTAFVKAQGYVTVSGDRYLTSSTTSLAIGNGSKSLTIGTGLSYSALQDIIITLTSDPTNYHMHGTVTSYNSGTGALVVDVKNHTGTGTFSAWTVNVGGLAPASSVVWGDITGTLSSQTDLQTALDGKIADAPSDGSYYVRKDGAWEALIIS